MPFNSSCVSSLPLGALMCAAFTSRLPEDTFPILISPADCHKNYMPAGGKEVTLRGTNVGGCLAAAAAATAAAAAAAMKQVASLGQMGRPSLLSVSFDSFDCRVVCGVLLLLYHNFTFYFCLYL